MSDDWWRQAERSRELDANITRARRETDRRVQRSILEAGGAKALAANDPNASTPLPSAARPAIPTEGDLLAKRDGLPARLVNAVRQSEAQSQQTAMSFGFAYYPGRVSAIASVVTGLEPKGQLSDFKMKLLRSDYYNELALLGGWDLSLLSDFLMVYDRYFA